jgi:hypothetical protein
MQYIVFEQGDPISVFESNEPRSLRCGISSLTVERQVAAPNRRYTTIL